MSAALVQTSLCLAILEPEAHFTHYSLATRLMGEDVKMLTDNHLGKKLATLLMIHFRNVQCHLYPLLMPVFFISSGVRLSRHPLHRHRPLLCLNQPPMCTFSGKQGSRSSRLQRSPQEPQRAMEAGAIFTMQ